MLLRLSCRIGLPARQRAGSGDLRDRATGDVLDTAPRRAAADAASPDAAARRRPRWRAAHSANLFAPVPHGHRVPVAREGEERTGRQGRARPSPSRPATPAIRRLRLADGSPLNAASYVPPGCSRDHQRVKSDRTPSDYYRYAGMAELADATDLKSRPRSREAYDVADVGLGGGGRSWVVSGPRGHSFGHSGS